MTVSPTLLFLSIAATYGIIILTAKIFKKGPFMNDITYDGFGRAIPMGTSYTQVEGFTQIDTPEAKGLYCEVTITAEGDMELKFNAPELAGLVAKMMFDGSFSGFDINWAAAMPKNDPFKGAFDGNNSGLHD